MDGETARTVRQQLIAMRAIVRVWDGMQSPDTRSVLDMLHGLLDRAMVCYPPSGGLHDELLSLQRYLGMVKGYGCPEEVQPYLFERLSAVTESFDRIHGVPVTMPAANDAADHPSDHSSDDSPAR